ncbi:MAG TPA: hypothetical protein VK308_07120 [Pyrinomonadaceae bacterium]|nr:hypothetical protein [Pyrinomonadaceae bacterium]
MALAAGIESCAVSLEFLGLIRSLKTRLTESSRIIESSRHSTASRVTKLLSSRKFPSQSCASTIRAASSEISNGNARPAASHSLSKPDASKSLIFSPLEPERIRFCSSLTATGWQDLSLSDSIYGRARAE